MRNCVTIVTDTNMAILYIFKKLAKLDEKQIEKKEVYLSQYSLIALSE